MNATTRLARVMAIAIGVWILPCLFSMSTCHAGDWTTKDTLFQLSYSALHILDWGQTRFISKNPDKYFETNPILGKHPKTGTVDAYFAGTLAGHALVSYFLPPEYRRIWQCVTIGLEAGMVGRNASVGIKLDF